MLSDIEIAQNAKMLPIKDIAMRLGLLESEIQPFGHYKAKVTDEAIKRLKSKPDGALILVTAINPTPAGEGKTTTTVGLGQALAKIGKKAIITLREPSMGPVFGVKGGAAGGGYSQVVPMEDINLHFTGDIHAVTAANNLLCAVIDNHIHQGNELQIDPRRITFRRAIDMNERALRDIVISLGGRANGMPRQDGFNITAASEVMAILCLAEDMNDLKRRLGNILIGYRFDGSPVYCRELKVHGAMAAVLKEAIMPNLIQTLENTPCLMHGGPFANIAHGCNSVRATKLALKLADFVVTEAGFGADLGAEKFFDIKCRVAGLRPSAVVIVATIRALKSSGGAAKAELFTENTEALKKGLENLSAHIDNVLKFGVPCVVSINNFVFDTERERDIVARFCEEKGVDYSFADVYSKGGEGGLDLAQKVVNAVISGKCDFKPLYSLELGIKEKIELISKSIYGADGVTYSAAALKSIDEITQMGASGLPVCMAKTQYSLSDDPSKLGRPRGFQITVREVRLSAGAGFVVALTGDIMTLPGLPKVPSAQMIDIDEKGNISGLF